MRAPDNFSVQELVPQAFYERFGDSAIRYFDPRLLVVLGEIREYLDEPMTINNWSTEGQRNWSGLRTPGSPYFSLGSAHSWGMAFDAITDHPASATREALLCGDLVLSYPVRIEMDITWLHVDVMNISDNPVEAFYP